MTALRITDLAQPQLTEVQRGALDATKDMVVDLSVAGILADASRKTKLDDFGPQDFLRRLQLLCDEWSGDTGLTNIGKLTLRNSLLQYARNRLLIQDVLQRHPGAGWQHQKEARAKYLHSLGKKDAKELSPRQIDLERQYKLQREQPRPSR